MPKKAKKTINSYSLPRPLPAPHSAKYENKPGSHVGAIVSSVESELANNGIFQVEIKQHQWDFNHCVMSFDRNAKIYEMQHRIAAEMHLGSVGSLDVRIYINGPTNVCQSPFMRIIDCFPEIKSAAMRKSSSADKAPDSPTIAEPQLAVVQETEELVQEPEQQIPASSFSFAAWRNRTTPTFKEDRFQFLGHKQSDPGMITIYYDTLGGLADPQLQSGTLEKLESIAGYEPPIVTRRPSLDYRRYSRKCPLLMV